MLCRYDFGGFGTTGTIRTGAVPAAILLSQDRSRYVSDSNDDVRSGLVEVPLALSFEQIRKRREFTDVGDTIDEREPPIPRPVAQEHP